MVKAPKSSHITPILRSLHWLKINERIEYKLVSLTYKVLTTRTSQPDYLHNLISFLSTGRTRYLLSPYPSSTICIFVITNHQPLFTYASPCLWNPLPSFRQPHSVHSPPGSPHPTQCPYHLISHHLNLAVTLLTFHSRLKTTLSQILSSVVISSGLPSRILNMY